MASTPSNFTPSATSALALGLDIGGTAIKAVCLDITGKIVRESEIESLAQQGPEALRGQMRLMVENHIREGLKPSAIGIGCAGSVDGHRGIVRYSPNFAAGKNLNLRQWIEQDFGIHCIVENDANCAAVAEWKLGRGKGKNNLILITLGTGVGGGLILGGKLFRGATGTGGEIGHFVINAPGPAGTMKGLPGTFEVHCSATAIRRNAKGLSARDVFKRAPTDPECQKIVDEFIHYFQIALASLANIFDPDMILLGGAVSEGVMEHITPIRNWVKAHVFDAIAEHMEIEQAQYGNLAGSIGAALLAQDPTLS